MHRLRSLSGTWQFQLDMEGKLQPAALLPERHVTVPLPWQSEHSDLHQYTGYAWYQTNFALDPSWLEGDLLLHFGAVDYWCQVYVNGEQVGEHEGGYTPFVFSIRDAAHPGENTLAVRVYDVVQTGHFIPRWWSMPQPLSTKPPFDAATLPHGKQTWYVDVSGIWQDVTLHAVPATYIRQMHLTPDLDGSVRAVVDVVHPQEGTLTLTIGEQIVGAQVSSDVERYTLTVQVPDVQLWTPDAPHLYEARVTLNSAAGADEAHSRIGFRALEARDGKLWLNGEPFMLVAALDQDIYPETIYTPPSRAFLRDQFQKAKALGLNCLRCHIKPPDPVYLDLADEMGMLIWAEIPSWRTWHVKTTVHPAALQMDETLRERVRTTLRDMIARDYNHPSLMIWTIVNEDWGTALLLSAQDRAFVRELYDLCKLLDPTRLVVDNSPCPAPWGYSPHIKSDINDFHIYTNIPDQAENFDSFIQNFALRPAWTFSLYGDGAPTGSEPLVLSEFGNWGLPTLENIGKGGEPDWFYLGAWWNPYDGEPGFPQGVEARFAALGLNAIWKDYSAFAQATQWHQFYAMKYEIEAMRRLPSLSGYVITELSDIYWESNGLLDFARGQKVYHECLTQFNHEDVVIPHISRYAYWDDELVTLALYASHYSSRDWSQARVTTALNGERLELPAPLKRGETQRLGVHYAHLPTVELPRTVSVDAAVVDAHGQTLAHNEAALFVLPAHSRAASYTAPVAVMSGMTQIDSAPQATTGSPMTIDTSSTPTAEAATIEAPKSWLSFSRDMHSLGYSVTQELGSDTRVLVTTAATADMIAWVREGGDMLLISPLNNPFFWQQARGGTYGGSWVTTWSWLRPGIHKRLAHVANPLGLPFLDIMPQTTLLGLPVEVSDYQGDFLAGQVGGWVRHPAVHTVQFRCGRGRVILTTFRLTKMLLKQPAAAAMLHDLVEYLVSDACQPTLTV